MYGIVSPDKVVGSCFPQHFMVASLNATGQAHQGKVAELVTILIILVLHTFLTSFAI